MSPSCPDSPFRWQPGGSAAPGTRRCRPRSIVEEGVGGRATSAVLVVAADSVRVCDFRTVTVTPGSLPSRFNLKLSAHSRSPAVSCMSPCLWNLKSEFSSSHGVCCLPVRVCDSRTPWHSDTAKSLCNGLHLAFWSTFGILASLSHLPGAHWQTRLASDRANRVCGVAGGPDLNAQKIQKPKSSCPQSYGSNPNAVYN